MMTLKQLVAWRPFRSSNTRRVEAGADLFRGIRLRLTLWYSGVLALALVVGGLVLYFGLQDLTMSPVRESLRTQAAFQEAEWLRRPPHICGHLGGDQARLFASTSPCPFTLRVTTSRATFCAPWLSRRGGCPPKLREIAATNDSPRRLCRRRNRWGRRDWADLPCGSCCSRSADSGRKWVSCR